MPILAAGGLLSSMMLLSAAAVLLYAALHDIAARTIPNQVPAGLLGIGLVLRLLSNSVCTGLMCAAILFLLGFICWRRGWLGGGDVKLIAAVGFVLPPLLCPAFLGAMALAGGVLALIYGSLAAIFRRRAPPPRPHRTRAHALPLWRRALGAERWRLSRGAPLPYASAIAAGYLFILLRG